MKYDFILQYVFNNYYFYYLTIHVKFSFSFANCECGVHLWVCFC